MAPKTLTKPENRLPELVDGAGEKMNHTINTVASMEKDEVLAAGIDLGRIEALDFVATIATSSMLSIYENVSKTKAWRFLRNPESCDGSNFESLAQFCDVKLGRSYRRLQELLSNKKAIGQEAFEQAERLGLRQVDFNAIKALPAPDQELIRRATEEAQSRDEVLDLLQELASRHAKEKETLTKERDEATANSEAKERLIADKDAKINSLTVKAGQKVVADTDWPDALIPLCDQLAACKREIDHAFSKLETARIAVLQLDMPEDQRPKFEAALKHVAEVYASALVSAERHYLKDQVVFAQTLGAYLEMDEV